jgi:hypothetical protein
MIPTLTASLRFARQLANLHRKVLACANALNLFKFKSEVYRPGLEMLSAFATITTVENSLCSNGTELKVVGKAQPTVDQGFRRFSRAILASVIVSATFGHLRDSSL